MLFECLPVSACQSLGQALGSFIYYISQLSRVYSKQQETLIATQLNRSATVLKILNQAELKRLERHHWRDLGRRLGEWLAGRKALELFDISEASQEHLNEIQRRSSEGRPQLILTAHFGHWELLAGALRSRGFRFSAVASAPKNGALGRWLKGQRARLQIETIHPQGGARELKDRLQAGEIVALLIDQSTRSRSITEDFLGQDAPMSLIADRLITRFNTEVHWLISTYQSDGQYRLSLKSMRSLDVSNEGTHPFKDSEKKQLYVLKAHTLLERAIIDSPEQWVWIHKRWKNR